jgi:plastocyanin
VPKSFSPRSRSRRKLITRRPRNSLRQTADPLEGGATIAIDMADTMRFTPAEITVKRGETVRFVVAQSGADAARDGPSARWTS